MSNSSLSLYWLSTQVLILEAPPPHGLRCQQMIWRLAEVLRGQAWLREIVPGMNNLTLELSPDSPPPSRLAARLQDIWSRCEQETNHSRGREIDIPVRYGGRHGPDLDTVARHCGLSPDQVIERHSAAAYIVYFLGFQPGFAYLGGLDPLLATPRRDSPRLRVPAGSVAIGGGQTGVYPADSPGGWQIIGHTSVSLFDPRNSGSPSLLLPGDTVRFVPQKGRAC
ncbi:5-oxoprolinase subunit PxpB [Chromobacterium sp. IIBBL 290-4]|uniref:5-oxoprolinase subunit PxpB n=1 Tax=Chromobacterium sp. IIBBL 290-4 TaxID=2953890 RepID=UPI0020B76711|nr:5-oxoprolinase subunit PxpB [Chromobacterium sp. IIBBL 290-4]UTH74382.1 5-oxoprolinase subunit PxpB [Chromobacterium sp. IIBBL 290-4]